MAGNKAGFLTHDNNYHFFVTKGPTDEPKAFSAIENITSVSAIGGTRSETDMRSFSSIGAMKKYGTLDNGNFTVQGYQVNGEYQFWMNLLNLNKPIFIWIVEIDDERQAAIHMRFWAQVSQVQRTDASVDGAVSWSVTLGINGQVYYTPFADPLNNTSGKPIEKLTLVGSGNKTSITEEGGSLLILCDIEPFDASNPAFSFTVDSEDSAYIDAGGRLFAKKNGSVQVTAHAEDGSGVTGEISITITGQKE